MTESMEDYAELDPMESFDEFESTDEAVRRPGRPVPVSRVGVQTGTLLTPDNRRLSLTLPASVFTLQQGQMLQQALNANTLKINAIQAELARRRRLASSGTQSASPLMGLFLIFILMDALGDL
jgi:hypothetical protein